MVKHLFLIFIPLIVCSQDFQLKLNAEVDEGKAYENQPITGTLTVTHDKEEQVDEKSFQMEGRPLIATFIKTVNFSKTSNLVLTLYRFSLPPEKPGLKILPPILATVGNKKVKSTATTYEILEKPSIKGSDLAFLKLENYLQVPKTFYVGQTAILGYEIAFKNNISLTKENLPLLQAQGFEKIGSFKAETFQRETLSVQRITQLVKATEPGHYTFGPSFIEGKGYTTDYSGKKIFQEPPLQAKSPEITLIVSQLPKNKKPGQFSGAIGDFTIKSALLSPATTTIEDRLKLLITIKGKGNLEMVELPDILCNPGFSGLFSLNDLPPEVVFQDQTKSYTFDISPQTQNVHAIPPISFTFFNPENQSYKTIKTEAIPIQVLPLKQKKNNSKIRTFSHPETFPPPNFSTEIKTENTEKLARLASREGKKAGTIEEKEIAYNLALKLYQQIQNPKPATLIDIGDCYFELNTYPLALINYLRANQNNADVQEKIALTRKKLELDASTNQWSNWLILRGSQKTLLYLIFIPLLIFIGLLYFRFGYFWQKILCFILLNLIFIISLIIAFQNYFVPLKGILIRASCLYPSPNKAKRCSQTYPIPAGSEIKIIEKKGDFIKIRTSEGKTGYLIAKNTCLLL